MTPKNEWPDHVLSLWREWEEWKESENLVDFTGMLEQCIEQRLTPPGIRVLYADEQQDMSALGIAVIKLWATKVEKAVLIGDPNQSIYRFAGAVPESFINLKADFTTSLKQSYRVPKAVLEYSRIIINKASVKDQSEYLPANGIQGLVIPQIDYPDLGLPGTHMLICRCRYQADRWGKQFLRDNVLFHNPYRPGGGWNPTAISDFVALKAYLDLIAGKDIRIDDANKMINLIVAKNVFPRGAKTEFKKNYQEQKTVDMFDFAALGASDSWLEGRMDLNDIFLFKTKNKEIFLSWAKTNKGIFSERPRVIIGTIHSVKGGEADHVWIDSGISPLIAQEVTKSQDSRDDEIRLAYVAATRARQTVGILRSRDFANPFLKG